MHRSVHAELNPQTPAIILADSGERTSYAQLDEASNCGAQLFRRLGLKAGDAIAILLENSAAFLQVCWAAQRAGLYFTPIPTHLTPDEAWFIVNDSGARLLITSSAIGETAKRLACDAAERMPAVQAVYFVGDAISGAASWDGALAACPATRIADETAGAVLAYSSGTTGRPKGVKQPLNCEPVVSESPIARMFMHMYQASTATVFLSPGPLYHTAPLAFCMSVQRVGGTVVLMEKFEADAFLAAIERHKVTHTQVVPTMFVRLLKLAPDQRARHELSSLRFAIHAAAPCPVPVKRQMIEWWGPILHEYYGGTEAIGSTAIDTPQWLRKPGSVGRANWGELHICDEQGRELPAGEQGLVYFGGAAQFTYHNDARKTAESRHPQHSEWATLGDIGYVDEDGYLFLTDRKSFMIISGGVNIYPQETENVLITHRKSPTLP